MFRFRPKYLEDGELLLRGVRRFVNYRRDILPAAKLREIEAHAESFRLALAEKRQADAERIGKELTQLCEGAGPDYRQSALAENIEVFFVAIAIALGIRAYIAQPFKIPTGSMQPTLNGIIAVPSEEPQPNPLVKLVQWVSLGRSWIHEVAKEDDEIVGVQTYTIAKFFTRTRLVGRKRNYDFPGPPSRVLVDFGIRNWLNVSEGYDGSFTVHGPAPIKKGQVIARGYIDSGDQVIVDKFSYHFAPPRRGEVFVFTTKNIRGIRLEDPRMGSIHYIKRLAGVPGDSLRIDAEGDLWINGAKAEEFGLRRVMSRENGYRAYQGPASRDLRDGEYMALGDNSYNSADSRSWGPVPEPNLVGRALMVYWPFNRHWGPIR
jgi:signal peptidase I